VTVTVTVTTGRVDKGLGKGHTLGMKTKTLIMAIFALVLTLGACVTNKPKKELIDFTVGFDSPRASLGDIDIQFDRLFSIGGLRKIKVGASYFPQEDAVCLQFKTELITYYQYWSRDGRGAFISALAQYNEDYDSHSLDSRGWKTKQKYDTIRGFLIWQLHRFAVKANANMNVELGYTFYQKSPYFTVNQREAEYISPIARDENKTSQVMTMFFTRAQAEELSALFNQDMLDSISSRNSDKVITYGADVDEYREED